MFTSLVVDQRRRGVTGSAFGDLDSAGSHLYWANDPDGTIGEANLNGSGAHTIITGQDSPFGVAAG